MKQNRRRTHADIEGRAVAAVLIVAVVFNTIIGSVLIHAWIKSAIHF